jgi:hypothetical protein
LCLAFYSLTEILTEWVTIAHYISNNATWFMELRSWQLSNNNRLILITNQQQTYSNNKVIDTSNSQQCIQDIWKIDFIKMNFRLLLKKGLS